MSLDNVIGTFKREGFPQLKKKEHKNHFMNNAMINASFDYLKDNRNGLNISHVHQHEKLIRKHGFWGWNI